MNLSWNFLRWNVHFYLCGFIVLHCTCVLLINIANKHVAFIASYFYFIFALRSKAFQVLHLKENKAVALSNFIFNIMLYFRITVIMQPYI